MKAKSVLILIILGVFSISGWQLYRLSQGRQNNPEVLADTTLSLEERVAALESRVTLLERNSGLVKPVSKGVYKEQYVQISGGDLNSPDWQKIEGTDFTFDLSYYGKSAEVSWQGWVENGHGSVRIYDATNHRAVDNSEISVDSGVRSSFYSKPISIWRGQNQYYLEGKNPLGSLSVTSPRLKIVTR